MVDDQRQALPRERDPTPRHRAAGPALHVDAAVAVGDERRKAVLQRLVPHPIDRRPILAVAVDEAAVERRKQTPPLVVGHRHRPTHRRVRRLVPARVERDGRPRVVEPRDVGDDPRVVDLGAKLRHEHPRTPTNDRAGARPQAFTGQRMRENSLDRRRPARHAVPHRLRPLRSRSCGQGDGRQALELRATLLRRLPAVVVVLHLVDQPVAVMGPQPLDTARPERQTRRLHHRRRVRVDRRREQGKNHHRRHETNAPVPPPTATIETRRLSNGTGRVQDQQGKRTP